MNDSRATYVNDVLNLMSESDWSRYPELADVNEGDMQAAALTLWDQGVHTPSAEKMIVRLHNRYGYFSDENALAHAEEDTVRFLDQADELKLGAAVLDRISHEVAQSLVRRYRARGWFVVDLINPAAGVEVKPEYEGFYIFTGSGV